jgi:hypothetical protein
MFGKEVIAGAVRERRTTPGRTTVVTTLRWWFALTAAALLLVACGGGRGSDTYARGTQVQEECCENLQGPPRDACLGEVIRVGDPAAAKTTRRPAVRRRRAHKRSTTAPKTCSRLTRWRASID